MVFSSTIFIFLFLPAVLGLYYLAPKPFRNGILLIASLLFYSWGEGYTVIFLLASICVNYLSGLLIARYHGSHGRLFLGLGVIANVLGLVYYKYTNFFVDNLNALTSLWNANPLSIQHIALPIGVSFFTFQSISYLIDLYRKEVDVQKNPFNLALYISLFPQLVAGPIVRYHDVAREIERRECSVDLFSQGVQRFIIGLAKKVLIANPLALVADRIFDLPTGEIGMAAAWLGITCYTLQIYFDFSGYSDMAIGLGKMFGLNFLENFNFPYISRSIQEFWRRWHISLSSWFRDYLYIPLGGNRKGVFRTYFNLFLVFLVTGFWHGASWNFVVWGLFHGSFLIIERLGLGKLLARTWTPINHVYVILVAMVGWVFFRAEDLPKAVGYIGKMFSFSFANDMAWAQVQPLTNHFFWLILTLGIVLSTPIHRLFDQLTIFKANHWSVALFKFVAFQILLICAVSSIANDTYNPFIYYRF